MQSDRAGNERQFEVAFPIGTHNQLLWFGIYPLQRGRFDQGLRAILGRGVSAIAGRDPPMMMPARASTGGGSGLELGAATPNLQSKEARAAPGGAGNHPRDR